jgi:replicative DNA helicase
MIAETDRVTQQTRLERSLLGAMLRWPAAIDDVLLSVTEDDLQMQHHRYIFSAILHQHEHGKPVDLVAVADVLHARKQIEDIGGYTYLAYLWDSEPTGANSVYYAGLVRDRAIVRNLGYAGAKIVRDAENNVGPGTEQLEAAERSIFEIGQIGVNGTSVVLSDALGEACDRIDQRKSGRHEFSGVPTGLVDLDDLTAGLQNSEFIVLAARPSLGKTSLAIQVAVSAAHDFGLPVLFVSLEQSRVELGERVLCNRAKVGSHQLRRGFIGPEEVSRILATKRDLDQAALHIDHTPSQSVTRIAANARRLKRKADIRLVVIDYLQLIDPADKKAPRQEQVASISRRLKLLSRELAIPVLCLAQLNRNSEDRADGRPRLADLRESGALEADADTVLLLHRPKEPDHSVEVIVAKQRNGATGSVMLAFCKEWMRFENYAIDGSVGTAG